MAEALVALWQGRADADPLNRLVTAAGMTWPDVAMLRAYRRYRRQVDPRYASGYVDEVLVQHPDVARTVVELFRARFGGGEGDPTALLAELEAACDKVERLDHDRILRGLVGTVEATIRTNVAVRPEGPLGIVLDSAAVPDVPEPVPYREIFVHGPTVEGVHLRAGPVARGGIRYSDRPEDLRAEVLDLMRTQVLKNALIVPTGAKGGFVLRGPASRAVPRRAVRGAYETFIGCMLDLVDPDDDPYLVVAADKGTAAFSDVANRIAVDRAYWLGDAFASGGSVGYDHRALGITARGAWVAIDRHFRELDVDVPPTRSPRWASGTCRATSSATACCWPRASAWSRRSTTATSSSIPTPTRRPRWPSGRRLHDLAGSSWQDYDRTLLSEGGGVLLALAQADRAAPARCRPPSASTPRRSPHPSSSRRSCARRSTCSTSAASAPTCAARPSPTPASTTGPTPRCGSPPTSCGPGWWARAPTSGSPSGPASSTPVGAAASTWTRSTTRPGSTPRTAR